MTDRAGAHLQREERVRENELVRALIGALDGPFAFRCECVRESCREMFVVPERDALFTRLHPDCLLMAAGHEQDGDVVLGRRDAFNLVRYDSATEDDYRVWVRDASGDGRA